MACIGVWQVPYAKKNKKRGLRRPKAQKTRMTRTSRTYFKIFKKEPSCEKNSVAAEALAGNRDVSIGDTQLERCCSAYRDSRSKDLCLQYNLASGEQEEHWVPVPDLGSADECRETFRIIKERGFFCLVSLFVHSIGFLNIYSHPFLKRV